MNKENLGSVEVKKDTGVAKITFSHPAGNSLPGKLLAALVEAFQAVGRDEEVNLVILQSGGERAFCGGASFEELVAVSNLEEGKAFFMGFANVINAMRKCPKLIVGRIQGKAVGGGVGLAAATDYCMATKYASVKLSELAIGIGPFVIGPAVQRKIGLAAMSQLAINATEWKTAEWAQSKGLFNEVFATTEQLDAYIAHFSQQLAGFNPAAMQQLKTVFWEGTDHWDNLLAERAAISGELVLSEFTRNAIEKFKAKA